MKYEIKVGTFEGPLDLLLNLISKEKVDIYDIPINLITKQYMEYIYNMNKLDLELASDFILMASTLMEIKSKMLLPQSILDVDNDEDPREELVKRLLEYKKYKDAANLLKEFEKYEQKSYYKPREDLSYLVEDTSLDYIDLTELLASIKNIMDNVIKVEDEIDNKGILREKYNIKQCSDRIIDEIASKDDILFTSLLSEDITTDEVVTYFLAILELIRMKIILVSQHNNFSDIVIVRKESDLLDDR